ncbi:similar to Saccharomyces cerevisiae YMR132C JLP2 Protein of unknown function, contains sequence that closely resembles a J domain (typified by the E. coli DnaJ protein) [Maudiozyma barnettii]|uniref:NFACT RNA-binding domain-containing protein n=1 Tax=Maudiozyma barnettii TaxID=61262 RepID=A0A8H2VFE6_9SACH|nr:Jlp2p [Kazachstania barnettii]CAB4254466.1 similar to Saccharomyces cerevisiae YMR132C JLP2 Protein of unknown function, contains sequence that closely resembles a J domain (typified by the E. coli DnaJ protein) [Kazachstania barnettii]CAD1782443.1 similar to Saccharomyces cerevisiae YMR132C JLP2 Protein of unknown function, contains sequence that closely resembles a J domain (typified by the E. coli DnaJ protein) [Kazachstania barnettii]
MVYFFESKHDEYSAPHMIVTGKDKFENDFLIKYGFKELEYIWFHADSYSSGHIYLQLTNGEKSLDDVPDGVINDCLQLCKASSIAGNKLPECTILITPWTNLRKNKYMNPGEVSFKTLKNCKRRKCFSRDNKIINRLTKTRVEMAENVEETLHDAKKSKDGFYFNKYLAANNQRLIEEEIQRQRLKKEKKKQQKKKNPQKQGDVDVELEKDVETVTKI